MILLSILSSPLHYNRLCIGYYGHLPRKIKDQKRSGFFLDGASELQICFHLKNVGSR